MGGRRFFNFRFVHPERRRHYNWALILFGSIMMCFFIQRHVIGVGIVTDRSMLPTLPQETTFLINKYLYHFVKPARGEVVVFRKTEMEQEWYVKRVIGLEGERIAFKDGQVFINNKRLKEPYVSGKTYPDIPPLLIPPGTCFVMGDNRANSEDSRQFGPMRLDRIEGKIKPGRWFPLR
jgi:signal peptidase I